MLVRGSADLLGARAAVTRLARQGWDVSARNTLLLLLVLFENVQAENSRSETRSLFALSPLRHPIVLVGTVAAQLIHIAAMYTPGLRDVLQVAPVRLLARIVKRFRWPHTVVDDLRRTLHEAVVDADLVATSQTGFRQP